MPLPLSVAEASRLAGITRPAIDRHVKAGRIARSGGGLDRASFEVWLAARAGATPATAAATHAAVEVLASVDGQSAANARAALALVDENGVFETRAEAERHRDSFIARLRQIEFDQKSGAVVDAAEMSKKVGEEYARVRTRLLSIPAEQAPQLARCKTVPELQDRLLGLIVRTLEELAFDRETVA